MKIKIKKAYFGSEGLKSIAKELREYADTRHIQKSQEFVMRLADYGIRVVNQNIDPKFGRYITFQKDLQCQDESVSAILMVIEIGQIQAEWNQYGTEMRASISPLLMAEFGSGAKALPKQKLPDGREVGQGSFIHGDPKHAEMNSWAYMDLDGNWHRGFAVQPTRPIFTAAEEMFKQIKTIAFEVWGA